MGQFEMEIAGQFCVEINKQERQRIQPLAKQEQAAIAQAQQAGTLAAPVAEDLAGLVQDRAAEGMAGVDAQEAIAAAQASAAAKCDGNHGGPRCADPECWNDSGPTMTLSQLNTRAESFGLGKISAATLEHHRIPFEKERSSVLITLPNARRLMLQVAMGARKLADELVTVEA